MNRWFRRMRIISLYRHQRNPPTSNFRGGLFQPRSTLVKLDYECAVSSRKCERQLVSIKFYLLCLSNYRTVEKFLRSLDLGQ